MMFQVISHAGSVMVLAFPRSLHKEKNQKQPLLAGVLVWIVLQCHLRMGVIVGGNGSRTPD